MIQKINWMQHLAIGLMISTALVFQTSCTKNEEQTEYIIIAGYVYFNTTQHYISITTYNWDRDSTYIMFPSDTLLMIESLSTGNSYNNYLIAEADSVRVVFDYSRSLLFTSDSISLRNIIKLANYDYDYAYEYIGGTRTDYHKYAFEFTEEDYENAE
jgi:hypothetical protein